MSDSPESLDLGSSTPEPQQDSFQAAIQHANADQSSFDPKIVKKTPEQRAADSARPRKVAVKQSTESDPAGLLKQIEREQSISTPESKAQFDSAKAKAVLSKYDPAQVSKLATRFGLDASDLSNPKVAYMLKSKLDGDSYIARLKGVGTSDQDADTEEDQDAEEADDQKEKDGEEGDEENGEEAKKDEAQAPEPGSPESYQAYVGALQQAVADPRLNDPVMVQAFEQSLSEAFGASTPEAQEAVKGLSQTLHVGAVSMMNSMVPQIVAHHLDALIESRYPSLAQQWQDNMITSAWNAVRRSEADFRNLPDFDSDEFSEKVALLSEKNPWMDSWTPTGPDGSPLPLHEIVQAKCQMAARLMSGQRIDPERASALIELGRKQAQQATRKVTAGKIGGGKRASSMGEFAQKDEDSQWHESFRETIARHNRNQRSSD